MNYSSEVIELLRKKSVQPTPMRMLVLEEFLKSNSANARLAPIKKEIRHQLHELGIEHTTIEFEAKTEDCTEQVDF